MGPRPPQGPPAPHSLFCLMKRATASPGSSLPSNGSSYHFWSRRGTCPRFPCSPRGRAAVGQQGSCGDAGLGSPGTEAPDPALPGSGPGS